MVSHEIIGEKKRTDNEKLSQRGVILETYNLKEDHLYRGWDEAPIGSLRRRIPEEGISQRGRWRRAFAH